MNSTEHIQYSIVRDSLLKQKINCSALLGSFLKNIDKNIHLNAFIEVFTDEVIKRADIIDKKIRNGSYGKLAGMIIGIKDNICYKDHIASAASKMLENHVSIYSSTVVERLLNEDAIIIGRLNCDEFAMGSSNERSIYGNVLNPINNAYVPGGSSGGSVAAVKAGLCMAALGTDTGGSIRQPASYCDVIGFKPTYGRVSRFGSIAYASSFDQIGPIARNIEDIALIMEVISGADDYDSTLSSSKVPEYSKNLKYTKKAKIAYFNEYLKHESLDSEIKKKTEEIIYDLKDNGHKLEEINSPYMKYLIPTYHVLTSAEASSNMARYGGVHYGYRSENAEDRETNYINSRTEGFGEEVKRKIMLGTYVLSETQAVNHYSRALKVRRLIKEKIDEIFEEYDFILTPTTPSTAFKIGEIPDFIELYLQDLFLLHANIAGIPAISLPLGKHSNGLAFGIQIMANKFEEKDLFSFSEQLMKNKNFNNN